MNIAEFIDIPITLAIAHHKSRRLKSSRNTMLSYLPKSLRDAVFERDKYLCRCCGFRSKKYQEVLARNGNIRDIDNMVTACIFCHQCFDLNLVQDMRSGVFVWLPEITQADLHHLAREIYIARIRNTVPAQKARDIFASLYNPDKSAKNPSRKTRNEVACERLGTDDPFKLVNVIQKYALERDKSEFEEVLQGIRLLPLDRRIIREADLEFNQFPQILAYWRSRSGPMFEYQDFKWLDYMEQILFSPQEVAATSLKAEERTSKSYVEMAVKLLRDSGEFFHRLADDNPPIRAKMKENADVYKRIADLLEKDPTGYLKRADESGTNQISQDISSETQSSSYANLTVKLLREAAGFFRTLGKQNEPVKEQMELNARVFEQVADLLNTDPKGRV